MISATFEFKSRGLSPGEFPAPQEPAWAKKVDRWNQLDEAAFSLLQAYWDWKETLAPPSMIFLASPGASNPTDRAFAQSGAVSPARFAHTLPNTRGTALLQAMGWSGPLICLQNGAQTLSSGLLEGVWALSKDVRPRVWVLGVSAKVFGCFLDYHTTTYSREPANEPVESLVSDSDLTKWLEAGTPSHPSFVLGGGVQLMRKNKL